MIISLLHAVHVCELVLVVQEQYEQVPVLPWWVANVYVATWIVLTSVGCILL